MWLAAVAVAAAVSVMTDTGGSPAKQVTAGTPLKQQQGGSGGKVLTVNILQVGGKPKLVLLAATSARFSSRWGEGYRLMPLADRFSIEVRQTQCVWRKLRLTHNALSTASQLTSTPAGY